MAWSFTAQLRALLLGERLRRTLGGQRPPGTRANAAARLRGDTLWGTGLRVALDACGTLPSITRSLNWS